MRPLTVVDVAVHVGRVDPLDGFQGWLSVVVTALVAALVLAGIVYLLRSRRR